MNIYYKTYVYDVLFSFSLIRSHCPGGVSSTFPPRFPREAFGVSGRILGEEGSSCGGPRGLRDVKIRETHS